MVRGMFFRGFEMEPVVESTVRMLCFVRGITHACWDLHIHKITGPLPPHQVVPIMAQHHDAYMDGFDIGFERFEPDNAS
jgi:hypothetical protein